MACQPAAHDPAVIPMQPKPIIDIAMAKIRGDRKPIKAPNPTNFQRSKIFVRRSIAGNNWIMSKYINWLCLVNT